MTSNGKFQLSSLVTVLWIGVSSLIPPATGTEPISNISLSPPPPAALLPGDYVYVSFDYSVMEPGGVVIFARPFTNGSPTLDYAAHGSKLYPAGKGSDTGFFTIKSGDVLVDQISFRMYGGDPAMFFETRVPVEYYFGNSIANFVLSPASPAALLPDEHVRITFDYATTEPGGVRILAQPFTNGAPTPDCVVDGPRHYPAGKHSASVSFATTAEDVVVDHVRFQMYNADQSVLLFETSVPVEYGFGNYITNLVLSPPSPAALHNNEHAYIAFDYATTEPGGVRILAQPFTDRAPTPDYAAQGSPVYPAGKGSDIGYFTITSGDVVVDQIRFQMYNADRSVLLFETTVPVEYGFGNSIINVAISPSSPAALLPDEHVSIAFDYATTEPGGVRILVQPFTNGALSFPYIGRVSPLQPAGKGNGTSFLAAPPMSVVVDQLRFQMYNADESVLLLEVFVPVEYHCGNSITNISLSPPSPATLPHREYVYVAFDYATIEPGGVRIFARPLANGSPDLRSVSHPSPLHPEGKGSDTGYCTITSGDVVVDQIRFRMYNADQSGLLLETFVPVEYHFIDVPAEQAP